MDKNRIYAVQTDASGKVSLAQVWAQTAASGLAAGFSNLVVMEIDDRIVLVGYNKATQETTVYGLSDGDPWIQPLDNRIDLTGGPWDIIQSFMFGNDPYLMTYRADQPRLARAERTSVPRKDSPSDHASACIRWARRGSGLFGWRAGWQTAV
jgi:hypothetical protein